MNNYKYNSVDYATGVLREIYRSEAVAPTDFGTGNLWRAKKDRSWPQVEVEVLESR